MKLIIKEYLSSLRERGELDVVIPDLLSQMGLNVFSRPGRGTRQDGVDAGAVGSLDGGPEKVYLFSIKPGDLTRNDWDGNSQALRSSLNEINDVYIPTILPVEHRQKNIVICICIGGDVQEQVRINLSGYFQKYTTGKIAFEEWYGDKLASLIQEYFLREDLFPKGARSLLRKSLALLDEPDKSHKHFALLIESLTNTPISKDSERIKIIRQISICLWILFAWAREADNMESAYLSGELALLHGWNFFKQYAEKKDTTKDSIETAFNSIFIAYRQICREFQTKNVKPYVGKLHGLSSAIRTSCCLDINLKLFDLLGRLAIEGIWGCWEACHCFNEEMETKQQKIKESLHIMSSLKVLISNNPVLLLPVKDDQGIEVFLAVTLMNFFKKNQTEIKSWFQEMMGRATFTYLTHGQYPCVHQSYNDLLTHPRAGDDEYRKNATSGSILYPIIAFWAALINCLIIECTLTCGVSNMFIGKV